MLLFSVFGIFFEILMVADAFLTVLTSFLVVFRKSFDRSRVRFIFRKMEALSFKTALFSHLGEKKAM